MILVSLHNPFLAQATLPTTSLDIIPKPNREDAANLEKLALQEGPVGDYFRLKLAEKELKENKTDAALRSVSPIKEPIFSFWKNVVQAEIYLDKNKAHEALALLKTLPNKPRPELSYGEMTSQNLYKRALVCRYLAHLKLNQDTKEDAASLLSLFPLHKDLENILGTENLQTSLSMENKIDKLHNLFFAFQYKEIPGIITPDKITTAKVSKENKCQALYELGMALKKNKIYQTTSIDAFQKVISNHCDEPNLVRALYWLGSIVPSTHSVFPDEREKWLELLYKKHPDSRLADDALYKLYYLSKGAKKASQEKNYLSLLTKLKKGDMRTELFFDLAYPHYKKGNYKKAAGILERVFDAEPTVDESYPKAMYWYARSLEKTENKKDILKANETYKKLSAEFPFSFYAILAASRLGATIHIPSLPKLEGSAPEEGWEYFSLVDEFNYQGHPDGARAILDLALHQHPEWEKTHTEYLTKKLMESQNYRKAIDLAATHFDSGVFGPIQETQDPMFAAFYPWAFKDKTKIGYNRTALPFGAIEGIIREESLFQKNAMSWVGATGLMQLMPGTAKIVKNKLPADIFIDEDLTDAQSNIILGSAYLNEMKEYFDNQLPLAIMAYNAGPGNVKKWLRKFGNLELDEFIETIPFSETKGYVKRVMRSMHVYGSLYHEIFFKNPSYFSFKLTQKEKIKGGKRK